MQGLSARESLNIQEKDNFNPFVGNFAKISNPFHSIRSVKTLKNTKNQKMTVSAKNRNKVIKPILNLVNTNLAMTKGNINTQNKDNQNAFNPASLLPSFNPILRPSTAIMSQMKPKHNGEKNKKFTKFQKKNNVAAKNTEGYPQYFYETFNSMAIITSTPGKHPQGMQNKKKNSCNLYPLDPSNNNLIKKIQQITLPKCRSIINAENIMTNLNNYRPITVNLNNYQTEENLVTEKSIKKEPKKQKKERKKVTFKIGKDEIIKSSSLDVSEIEPVNNQEEIMQELNQELGKIFGVIQANKYK